MQRTLPDHDRESGLFTRWPGLLSLALGWLAGPIAALANQEITYLTNNWVCGQGNAAVLHVAPAVCLAVSLGAGYLAYRDWAMAGRGVEDEEGTVEARSRFIAMLGMALSTFSAFAILAQWLGVFVLDPCAHP
jgi:hypothetical protein